MDDPAATKPKEFGQSSLTPKGAQSSRPSEPIEEPAAHSADSGQPAPDNANSARAPKKKQTRAKRQVTDEREEQQLPAKEEAADDPMLACARIESTTKRLACFDKLKRGSAQ
jgi:hypothetical protein